MRVRTCEHRQREPECRTQADDGFEWATVWALHRGSCQAGHDGCKPCARPRGQQLVVAASNTQRHARAPRSLDSRVEWHGSSLRAPGTVVCPCHKQRTEPRELRRSCVRATPRGVGVRVLNRPSELLGKRQQVRNGAGANANALPAGRVAKTSGRGEEVPAERGAANERSSSSHMRTLASTRATRGSRRRHRRDEHPRAGRAALDEGGHSGRRLALTSPHRQRRTPRVAPNPLLQ